MNNLYHIILIGAPGSGKGTQAHLIKENFSYYHISTGNILREAVQSKTELGLKAEKIMNSGELVPDEVVGAIITEKLKKIIHEHNQWLFDGYPRNTKQAEFLLSLLGEFPIRNYKALYLVVDEDILIKRLSGRRTCSQCGFNYNIYFQQPKQDELCDYCGVALIHRVDDTKEVILERLRVYNKQTTPLINFYQEKGTLIHVDGCGEPEDVFIRVRDALKGNA